MRESVPNITTALKDLITFNKKFDVLRIDISYENFEKLNQDRSKSLKKGILRDPLKVIAQITWKGKRLIQQLD